MQPMTSPTPPWQPPPPPPAADPARVAGIFAVIGGVLLLVGSFLPWVTATTIFGQLSINGFDGGDGKITAAAGAAAAGFLLHGLLGRNWSSYLIGALAAVVGVLVAGYDFNNLSDLLVSEDGFSASRGVGIYACCGGGLLAVVAGFTAMTRAKLATPPPTYTPVS